MEKVKQWIAPLIVGGVAMFILMVTVFGYVTNGTAADIAEQAAEDATVAALTPFCVANAEADPEVLAAMKELRSYQQRGAVEEADWAVYPDGADSGL